MPIKHGQTGCINHPPPRSFFQCLTTFSARTFSWHLIWTPLMLFWTIPTLDTKDKRCLHLHFPSLGSCREQSGESKEVNLQIIFDIKSQWKRGTILKYSCTLYMEEVGYHCVFSSYYSTVWWYDHILHWHTQSYKYIFNYWEICLYEWLFPFFSFLCRNSSW